MKTLPTYIALIGIAAFAGNGCSDGTTSTPDPSDPISDPLPDPIDVPETEGCENLNHRYCSLPFPSDRWLAADSDSATGYRLRYDARAIPQNKAGTPFNVTPFDRLDGASPSGQLMTLFDEPADLTGQAFHDSIEKSLDESALIALIDLETGERVAHWVENDARAEAADETLFFIHPAARLLPNRSYGVAIGALNGASGAPLEPSEDFG